MPAGAAHAPAALANNTLAHTSARATRSFAKSHLPSRVHAGALPKRAGESAAGQGYVADYRQLPPNKSQRSYAHS
jgi:hypothetical protein